MTAKKLRRRRKPTAKHKAATRRMSKAAERNLKRSMLEAARRFEEQSQAIILGRVLLGLIRACSKKRGRSKRKKGGAS